MEPASRWSKSLASGLHSPLVEVTLCIRFLQKPVPERSPLRLRSGQALTGSERMENGIDWLINTARAELVEARTTPELLERLIENL